MFHIPTGREARKINQSRIAGLLSLLLFSISPLLAGYPPIQDLIDKAEEHASIVIEPGIYSGPLILDFPITIDGQHRVTIDAGGKGSVVFIDTDGATLKGLKLINSGESHNDIDSGVQVRGNFNVIKDNIIENCLFGVDLQQSNNNIVRRNKISSQEHGLGQRGDAVRLWYSFNNRIEDNEVINSRDMVVWYSADNIIRGNSGTNCRYSLHFMYSRYNLVENNSYYHNAVGIFVMYSDGIIVRNNYIGHADGPTGVGIGFKETSDLTIEGNQILYCASGLYIDISPFQPDTTNRFKHNLIAFNNIGARFLNEWHGNEFLENQFVSNMTQVAVGGAGSANGHVWEGNYWSDYEGFDQDQDGVGDTPFELYRFADRLWQNVDDAQFFKGTPMLETLDFMERLAPLSEPTLLLRDPKPSMTPLEINLEEAKDTTNALLKLLEEQKQTQPKDTRPRF
ncbi:MAG: copper ABC transporter substrate-binding protein [Acidobacteria bacterium]|nr:MAG: copper ABC transporter substrate-binding protein [Acidobacteriota bacterium]